MPIEVGNYVPLGQYLLPSGWNKKVTGVLYSPVPLFWNVEIKN